MSDSIFSQLENIRGATVPAVLQSGTRYPNPRFNPHDPGSEPYLTAPAVGSKPLKFDIHPITANEINDADALITEMPPALIQEQASPTGRGTVQARVGYDYDDPAYLAKRQKQIPLRDAAICLFGCDALRNSTPGASIKEQAENLASKVPSAVLEWLKTEIGDIAMITAVGEKDVTSFLAEGSGSSATKSSKNTSTLSPKKRKKKASNGRTARTSNTSSAKPPGSGE